VSLRPGARLDERVLRDHLQERLARYKIPRYVEFRDVLPTNATGKVLRARLREQARASHPSPDQTPDPTETP
jgi:fatty-acyl-CoA synthase